MHIGDHTYPVYLGYNKLPELVGELKKLDLDKVRCAARVQPRCGLCPAVPCPGSACSRRRRARRVARVELPPRRTPGRTPRAARRRALRAARRAPRGSVPAPPQCAAAQ